MSTSCKPTWLCLLNYRQCIPISTSGQHSSRRRIYIFWHNDHKASRATLSSIPCKECSQESWCASSCITCLLLKQLVARSSRLMMNPNTVLYYLELCSVVVPTERDKRPCVPVSQHAETSPQSGSPCNNHARFVRHPTQQVARSSV
jgi:hypothetical protein